MQDINEILVLVDQYIIKLINAIENAVKAFKQQKEDEGLKLLIQIIDGLSWVIETMVNLMPVLQEHRLDADPEKINVLLRELLGAMENEDFVLISDLLEYEVLEILSSWKSVIEKATVKN